MMLVPIPANTAPLRALAQEGEVVLTSDGPGRPVSTALTPEAVLASLEPLRAAAERAIRQRSDPASLADDEGASAT
jgi:hypothetical protein